MQKLSRLLHIIDAISEWVGKIISFVIVLMIGVVIWNVVMRYAFHSTAAWGQISTCGKLSVAYIILGAAYTLRTKAHINIDILYSRFPLRTRAIVDLVTSTLFFLFCTALLWKVIDYVEGSLKLSFSVKLFLPPYWPVSLIVLTGVSLFLLQGLAKFIRDLIMAITGKEAA